MAGVCLGRRRRKRRIRGRTRKERLVRRRLTRIKEIEMEDEEDIKDRENK